MAEVEKTYNFESGIFIISKREDGSMYGVRRWKREQPMIIVSLESTPDKESLRNWCVDSTPVNGDFMEALNAACAMITLRHELEDNRSRILQEASVAFSKLGDYEPETG